MAIKRLIKKLDKGLRAGYHKKIAETTRFFIMKSQAIINLIISIIGVVGIIVSLLLAGGLVMA